MPRYPKISPVLNNCPVHIITPELRDEVKKRSQPSAPTAFDSAYLRLKDLFAEYYDLDKSTFTWVAFHKLLEPFNAFDLQILFGPVLRLFIGNTIASNFPESAIEDHSTLNPESSRYSSLDPGEIYEWLLKPLGFNLSYFHEDIGINLEVHSPLKNAIAAITIYHLGGAAGAEAGGHWERGKTVEERIDYENYQDTQLHGFIPLLGNDFYTTQAALEQLKRYIKQKQRQATPALFTDIHLTLAQMEKFIFNCYYVDKNRAQLLLGPNLTEASKAFIAGYPSPQPVANEALPLSDLIDANLHSSDDNGNPVKPKSPQSPYTHAEYRTALKLLAPATIAPHPAIVTPQSPPERELRSDEICALMHVEHILFSDGLSLALYEICNQSDQVNLLTPDLIQVLLDDEHFFDRASKQLQQRAQTLYPTAFALKAEQHPVPILDEPEPEPEPGPAENVRASLNQLIGAIKSQLSTHVWMGLSRTDKADRLEQLIQRNTESSDLKLIYQELIWIVTTHRTRFGIFFHWSRSNSSSTATAKALSTVLLTEPYQALRQALEINENSTPESLRQSFDDLVSGKDAQFRPIGQF